MRLPRAGAGAPRAGTGAGAVLCWISTIGARAGLDQLRPGEVAAVPEGQGEGLGVDVAFYCADLLCRCAIVLLCISVCSCYMTV